MYDFSSNGFWRRKRLYGKISNRLFNKNHKIKWVVFEHFLSHTKCIFNEFFMVANPLYSIIITFHGFILSLAIFSLLLRSSENVNKSKFWYKLDKTSPEFWTSRLSAFFYFTCFDLSYRSTIDTIRWSYFPNTFFLNLNCFSIMQKFASKKLRLMKIELYHWKTHFF